MILLGFYSLLLFGRSVPTVNAVRASEVAREQVVWNDRLCPFSTFACDFLQAVYGATSYKGLTAEQVVCGWLLRPDASLRQQLHIAGEYARFSELFDDTLGYKLNTLGSDLPEPMRQLVRQSSAAVRLDEKVGDIILLTKGQLFRSRPADMEPLPAWRVEAEVCWNHTPGWAILLTISLMVLALVLIRWVISSIFS